MGVTATLKRVKAPVGDHPRIESVVSPIPPRDDAARAEAPARR
jgi:hypothetical protein